MTDREPANSTKPIRPGNTVPGTRGRSAYPATGVGQEIPEDVLNRIKSGAKPQA